MKKNEKPLYWISEETLIDASIPYLRWVNSPLCYLYRVRLTLWVSMTTLWSPDDVFFHSFEKIKFYRDSKMLVRLKPHIASLWVRQEARDEQVLVAYPITIRRRILRHLYLRHVRATYLFQGCRQKFLDALLGISKASSVLKFECWMLLEPLSLWQWVVLDHVSVDYK